MKGITIILVIILHSWVLINPHLYTMLSYLRMPVFIFLSGLFFSTKNSFKHFITNRTNRYIVPWVFFILTFFIGCAFFRSDFCIKTIKGELIYNAIIWGTNSINRPIWFLKCLFFLSLWSYVFNYFTKNLKRIQSVILVIAISFAAFLLNKQLYPIFSQEHNYLITLLFNVLAIQTIVLLPIFYLPYLFRNEILSRHRFAPMSAIFVVCLIGWLTLSKTYIVYHEGIFPNNYIMFMTPLACAVFCMYYVCYYIESLPYVSYMGRYSIIVLGTHELVHWLLINVFHITDPYINAGIILATAPMLIWLLIRIAPHFTAQKDLLKVDHGGKVRFSFKD